MYGGGYRLFINYGPEARAGALALVRRLFPSATVDAMFRCVQRAATAACRRCALDLGAAVSRTENDCVVPEAMQHSCFPQVETAAHIALVLCRSPTCSA